MISVVLCTRNRAPSLERCLRHLCELGDGQDLVWQLVVVDNASQDGTRAIIEKFAPLLPLTYAFEPKRGLSHARNRGLAQAKHAIIAFTDDDCLVDRDWAATIVTTFARQPGLGILGGRVMLADPSDSPVAIRDHDQAEEITTIARIVAVMSGCNMAFRREVFDAAGWFDPALGKGTRIGSAEDVDFLYRALKRGIRIAYSPEVVIRHAHGRKTPSSLERLAQEYVRGRGAFYCKFVRDRPIARMAYWEVRKLLVDWLRRPVGSASPRMLAHLAAGALYMLVEGIVNGTARAADHSTA